jgi:hypothetical protein
MRPKGSAPIERSTPMKRRLRRIKKRNRRVRQQSVAADFPWPIILAYGRPTPQRRSILRLHPPDGLRYGSDHKKQHRERHRMRGSIRWSPDVLAKTGCWTLLNFGPVWMGVSPTDGSRFVPWRVYRRRCDAYFRFWPILNRTPKRKETSVHHRQEVYWRAHCKSSQPTDTGQRHHRSICPFRWPRRALSLGKRPHQRTTGIGVQDIRDAPIRRAYASKSYTAAPTAACTERRLNAGLARLVSHLPKYPQLIH